MLGEDLRSQEVALPVPSALAGLTTGFEMGPGVPPLHDTPSKRCPRRERQGKDWKTAQPEAGQHKSERRTRTRQGLDEA